LDQHVQHLAFIVHGAPKKHSSPADLHHHLIEMPSGRGRLPALWQVRRDERSELDHPAARRFATHGDPALGEQLLQPVAGELSPGDNAPFGA